MTQIVTNEKYTINLVDVYAEENLFSSKRFLEHQIIAQQKVIKTFELQDAASGKRLAIKSFACGKDSTTWTSPATGAFGAIEASEFIAMDELDFFISSITDYLFTRQDCKKIVWRLPPQYYQSKINTKLQNVLFRQEWITEEYDLNFHLLVTNYEDFRSNLSSSKRRELNRITKSNPVFSEAITKEQHNSVYNVIRMNRESQGYPMTMSWEAIEALYGAIGDRMRFYCLTRDNIILAGAICLILDPQSMYVFYWGEHPDYRKDSPIVKLAEGIYCKVMEDGFKTLDIGTSTDHSEPNQGLINFKENIGCLVSSKITVSISKSGK